ncbi:MAG: hypothetical protein LBV41_03770 [Cytophagaceae bacterium]|jgi:hypothetical protein|nr:hypothetical protein [Cytophagaceae bacterium]
MKILAMPDIIENLIGQIEVLYDKKYFYFKDTPVDIADKLFDIISRELAKKSYNHAPRYFAKYGDNLKWILCKTDAQTGWYVFFEIYLDDDDEKYLVKHIESTHTAGCYMTADVELKQKDDECKQQESF